LKNQRALRISSQRLFHWGKMVGDQCPEALVGIRGAQLESEIFAITSADKPNRVVQVFIQILCARM
jgi:hypothetical protein